MKIITRYILREHLGPFTFAFTALTSLMLLNFISRQVSELVGKDLPWKVIGEFFLLAIPFTVALTLPMSVLVAVLYAFSRLAAENEVTALKATGVSPWRLVSPTIVVGVVMSIALLAFNDQVLPRANHQLKTLQDDISQTKPTLLLKEQVINAIAEGKFYLKADKIDQAHGRLTKVVIYDLADPMRRRTIYADSGRIAFAANRVDLNLDLLSGEMQEVPTDKPTHLDRLFYKKNRVKVRDVGQQFKQHGPDSMSKGDREMSICEMQQRLWSAESNYVSTLHDLEEAKKNRENFTSFPGRGRTPEPRSIGWAYCSLLRSLSGVKVAHAADVREAALHRVGQASVNTPAPVKQDTIRQSPAQVPAAGPAQQAGPPAPQQTQAEIAAQAAAEVMRAARASPAGAGPGMNSRVSEATLRLEIAQRMRDRYAIEIHKKFSLAAACLIFCIVAPPLALRFPRGGVGLVISVSLVVFALYYVGLIGGEALANSGVVAPFWAMWGTNVIMTLGGLVLLLRIGRDAGTGRGGGVREWLDERRLLREERRAAALSRGP